MPLQDTGFGVCASHKHTPPAVKYVSKRSVFSGKTWHNYMWELLQKAVSAGSSFTRRKTMPLFDQLDIPVAVQFVIAIPVIAAAVWAMFKYGDWI